MGPRFDVAMVRIAAQVRGKHAALSCTGAITASSMHLRRTATGRMHCHKQRARLWRLRGLYSARACLAAC
jgi:hypothetical protein